MSTSKSKPNRKVRIVAKIRGFTPQESQSSNSWISVSRTDLSDRVLISFTGHNSTSRKDVCEVDHFYEQNEGMDIIFSREIEPLIPGVLSGNKATFIGFGAKGSGKTYAIQGSDENHPGLATLTVAEILSRAEEVGKFVTISIYEAFQEHVFDILDPSHPEVQVLENAQGKIKLKGLSQVSVKSIAEFQKLYLGECSTAKTTQKTGLEQPQKSHKGLMINILSRDEASNMKLVGKINFVDLAGYEDCRRKGKNTGESISFNSVEGTKINRSLYAFLNVVHALNANENRVPYRESKLTRVLQDSLGGTNHVLILTCMNPLVCQDTANAMSLASRACQGINHILTDSTNRSSKGSSKPTVASSMKKVKASSLSTTTPNQTSSLVNLSQKKASSKVEGRKLFVDKNESITSEQKPLVCQDTANAMSLASLAGQGINHSLTDSTNRSKNSSKPTLASSMKKVKPSSLSTTTRKQTSSRVNLSRKKASSKVEGRELFVEKNESISSELATIVSEVPLDTTPEEETLSASVLERKELPTTVEEDVQREENHIEDNFCTSNDIKALTLFEGGVQEDPNYEVVGKDGSPPLSARLKELSNNLKSLCSSTPLCVNKLPEIGTPYSGQVGKYVDCVEPRTPTVERDNSSRAITNFGTPLEAFSARSTITKQSLVQDCLQFLNSANKEELKGLRGIGEKRATYILELREESPEPFKSLDDLLEIGMSEKQINGMMKSVVGQLFN